MNIIYLPEVTVAQLRRITFVIEEHNRTHSDPYRFSMNFMESESGEFYFTGPAEENSEPVAPACYMIAQALRP
jgi:hypothetical protein